MGTGRRSAAIVVSALLLSLAACGGGDDESSPPTSAAPSLVDAVAVTRQAPVLAYSARSRPSESAVAPVVVAGRATGDGSAYQVLVGTAGGAATLAGAETRLEVEAAGRCRVVDLAEVEPADRGTPLGTIDPESVLRLLEVADEVRHDTARGRDRWEGTVTAAAVDGAGTAEDPARVARMTGALGPDDEVGFRASGRPGEGLSTIRLDLPERTLQVTLGPVDGVASDVSSPVGCWPDGKHDASIEETLVRLQLDCTRTQADMVEFLADLPPEAVEWARQDAGHWGACSAVFDG